MNPRILKTRPTANRHCQAGSAANLRLAVLLMTIWVLSVRRVSANILTFTSLNDSGPGAWRDTIAAANGGATAAGHIIRWSAILPKHQPKTGRLASIKKASL